MGVGFPRGRCANRHPYSMGYRRACAGPYPFYHVLPSHRGGYFARWLLVGDACKHPLGRVAWWLFMSPTFGFALDQAQFVSLITFVLVCLLLVGTVTALHLRAGNSLRRGGRGEATVPPVSQLRSPCSDGVPVFVSFKPWPSLSLSSRFFLGSPARQRRDTCFGRSMLAPVFAIVAALGWSTSSTTIARCARLSRLIWYSSVVSIFLLR